MKKFLNLPVAFSAALLLSGSAHGASSATQTVSFLVTAINEFAVSGNPGPMTISTGSAGAAPSAVTDNSTLYAITTNANNSKITAVIDSALPPDVTLTINLDAPAGAMSAGSVPLGTTAADVVTGVARLNESGKGITYTLSTTANAGVVNPQSRTVTLTVTAGAI